MDAEEAVALFEDLDQRTLRLALLSSTHTAAATEELIEMGVSPEQIASSLAGALAVCAIRSNCPECTSVYTPHKLVLTEWFGTQTPPRSAKWRRGSGCAVCEGTGYLGESIVAEFWVPTDDDRKWILSQSSQAISSRRLRQELVGHTTGLGLRAFRAAIHGETTLEGILKVLPSQEVRSVRRAA